MPALWDQLERAARLRQDDVAIRCSGESLGWKAALDRAARMAGALRGTGLRTGDRIAFLSPNSITYLLMPFAADCAGFIFVPLNSRLAVPELVEQLKDSAPALLVAAPPFVDLACEAAEQAGVPVMMLDGEAGDRGFLDLVDTASPMSPAHRSADQPVAIYYTGGTTGRAKGVSLTGESLVLNALQWAQGVGARDDENLLVVAPMFHMVAALNSIIAVVLACNLTILERFTPLAALVAIERERVTNMGLVPAMIDLLLAEEGFADHDLRSLRTLSYGGSPISQETLKLALTKLSHVRLFQIYGQTEGGPTISVLSSEWHSTDPVCAAKLRSAGRPLPLTDLRIVRPDGSECDRSETGEIAVRGPAVSPGYWNRPEENTAAFRDGWLHTGDAGYLDSDGFLFIVDRIKDMIVSGGENVYAAEVERVLIQHPKVRECAVFGIPDARWGEAVHAAVRLHEAEQADEAELVAFCRNHISAFKSPRSVSFRIDPFPLTGAGKTDKRTLKAGFLLGNAKR